MMELITRDGRIHQACDRCHRVHVKFSRKGKTTCDRCRAELWDEELRQRRWLNRIFGINYYKATSRKRKRRKSA
jgi:hypothetical protein